MRSRTYYQILMVDPDADQDIISVVYRRLAQRYHPDVDGSPASRARMVEINEAWDTLKDPTRRRTYDAQMALRRERRPSDRAPKRATEAAPATEGDDRSRFGEAGPPPPGPAVGPVLEFGRYRGWTLDQIGRQDRDFLEWLQRHPAGRGYRLELQQLLRQSAR